MTTDTSLLQEILALVTGVSGPTAKVTPRQLPRPGLDLADQLAVFVRQLEHVAELVSEMNLATAPAGMEVLRAAHDDAAAIRDRPYDDSTLGPDDGQQLADRIRAGATALQVAAPAIVRAARLTDPARWLATTQKTITGAAADVLTAYATAVRDAWLSGKPAGGALHAADALMADFPIQVRSAYLAHSDGPQKVGLEQAIEQVISLRATLFGLTGPNPPTTPASYGDVQVSAGGAGTWLPGADLINSLDDARRRIPGSSVSAGAGLLNALVRKVQAYQVTLTGLIADQQLSMILEAAPLATEAMDRLAADRTALDAALDQVHSGFADGGGDFAAGATAVSSLLSGTQFKADFDAAVSQIQNIQMVETGVLTVAIVMAAALTGGVAAAAAEAAIGAVAGDAIFAGFTTWASAGGFAAEVITFTLVDRRGKELLFGSQSTADSSFAEDLFWTAVTMGVLRAVAAGYGPALRAVDGKDWRVRLPVVAPKLAVEQISLFAIGQVQYAAQHGDLMAAGDVGRTALQQAAMSILMGIGGAVSGSVRKRLGDELAAQVDAARLAAAEDGASQLAAQLARVQTQDPAAIDGPGLASAVEAQYNRLAGLIQSVPDGTAGKAEALQDLRLVTEKLEVRLAQAGLETSFAGPDQQSTAAPVDPGVVALAPEAQLAAEQIAADDGAPQLAASPAIDGAQEAATQSGQVSEYVDPPSVKVPPPDPAKVAKIAHLIDVFGKADGGTPIGLDDVDELAVDGLANLKAKYSDLAVRGLVARAGRGGELDFLRFLSNPEFAASSQEFTKVDYEAFADSDLARVFANQYGPSLANEIRIALTSGGGPGRRSGANFYPEPVIAALAVAAGEIEEAKTAGQPDPTAALKARTKAEWLQLIGVGAPKITSPEPATAVNFGIDRTSAQWKGLAVLMQAKYPGASAADISGYADIAQVMARGKGGAYSSLPEADRAAILRQFVTMCENMNLTTNRINGKVGALAEWMFLPKANRTVWKLGKQISKATADSSIPDDYSNVNNIPTATEGKATRFYELSVGDAAGRARQHMADISGVYVDGQLVTTGDVVNLQAGTVFEIWYFFDATPGQISAMMNEFNAPESKVTRVKFGRGGWQVVKSGTKVPSPD